MNVLNISAQCPICLRKSVKTLQTYDGVYLICQSCDLQYVDNILARSEVFVDFTEVGEQLYGKITKDGSLPQLAPTEKFALDYIRSNAFKDSEVKELFAEIGRFSYALKANGYTISAADPLSSHANLLSKVGVEAEVSLIGKGSGHGVKFIVIIESIVRLKSPLEFMKKLRFNYPNAEVLITTPSLRRSVLSPLNSINAFRPPHQLTRWTRTSLRNLLIASGYEVIKEKDIMLDFNMTKLPDIIKSLAKIFFITIGESAYSHAIIGRPKNKEA